ncbi:MAG: FAD binding domain-containing protein [Desulfomonilaceae bacterium]
MRINFKYLRPHSLDECLAVLATHGDESAILAGGTDLMISFRSGSRTPRFVLDISRLSEIRSVEQHAEVIKIGAILTYSELIAHPLIVKTFPALSAAMSCVGSLQIRNVGTLGGNIANSSPAADSIPPMMIHDAQVMIQKVNSVRIEKLERLIVGPYSNTLEPDELITGIILKPVETAYKQSYRRIARRKSLSIARVNMAVSAKLDAEGLIEDVRISVGSVAPTPLRIKKVEDSLIGLKPESKFIKETGELVARHIVDLVGVRHSTEYKRPAIAGLVIKCLEDVFID